VPMTITSTATEIKIHKDPLLVVAAGLGAAAAGVLAVSGLAISEGDLPVAAGLVAAAAGVLAVSEGALAEAAGEAATAGVDSVRGCARGRVG
jgi:hypothetical protein